MIIALIFLFSIFGLNLQPTPATDIRRDLDNPVAERSIGSFDFQGDKIVGPYDRTRLTLTLNPRFFTGLELGSEKLGLVHQLNLPVQRQPLPNEDADVFGLGDFNYRIYVTVPSDGNWHWGLGPLLEIPTGTKSAISTGKWSAGFAFAILYQPFAFSFGGTLAQKWSFAGDATRADVNFTEATPIVRIHIGERTTLGMLDTVKIDWKQVPDNRWTIPMGLDYGLLFKPKDLPPVQAHFGSFANIVQPVNAEHWYWRVSFDIVL